MEARFTRSEHRANPSSVSYNESMYDDNFSSPNDVTTSRDGRNGNNHRDKSGRSKEVDSYRPGARRYSL
jgi:hypothetical protein